MTTLLHIKPNFQKLSSREGGQKYTQKYDHVVYGLPHTFIPFRGILCRLRKLFSLLDVDERYTRTQYLSYFFKIFSRVLS